MNIREIDIPVVVRVRALAARANGVARTCLANRQKGEVRMVDRAVTVEITTHPTDDR